MSLVSGLITGTILALAYVFVASKGIQGKMNPGDVVLVIGAFTSVSGTLGQISSTFVAVDQQRWLLPLLGQVMKLVRLRSRYLHCDT